MGKRLSGVPVAGFLVLFVPAAIVLSGAAMFFVANEIRYEREQLEANERASVRLAASAVRKSLRDVTSDMQFLAEQPELKRAISIGSNGSLDRLAEQFAAYMDAHGYFDQIRWIDEQGMERLRVNLVNGVAHVVPREELQDKSKRGYFIEGMKMARGSIYVSPLDLNVENERVEVPHKPMIRFAMPVVDQAERHRGLVVLNYFGRYLTDDFRRAVGDQAGRLMLLNRNGYWLSSANPEDEFGFMLDRPSTLKLRAPDVWAAMAANAEGTANSAAGAWTWESFHPLMELEAGDMPGGPKVAIAGQYDYVWYAAMLLPRSRLDAIDSRVWSRMWPNLGLLLLAAAVVAAGLARYRQRIVELNEQLAERAQAAEAANLAKANFLANMSHEIRTPMNAILGLAYLLEKQDLPAEIGQQVHKIEVAGRSLLGIINDILDFSKIEAGRLEIEHAPFRLGDVLENLATIMAANGRTAAVELVISPPPRDIDQLQGDALRLEQVLINLTGNAIKFTEKGHIDVRVDVVEQNEREALLRFSVRDTGIGISPEKQQEIFAPFSQADASTTRRFGGTGLGLTISRRLVALMGGEIKLNSAPGLGSEFSFELRLERLAASEMSAPEMVNLDVLIADDNATARAALGNLAQTLGWTATLAESGEQAVTLALASREQGKPNDVIILDWQMPGMDGLSAARAIRDAKVGMPEPIIVMVTAFSREDLKRAPDSDLVDAVLSKPVTPSGLYNAVGRARLKRLGQVQPHLASLQARLQGLRLLVVDDSEINREVAREIFAGEGAVVAVAADGRNALDWLQAHVGEVDVVLMDVQMPVMDGYEATRRIRAMPEIASLPVVALTAGAFASQREMALAAGMTDFIAKPFDVVPAIALLRRVCGLPPIPPRTDAANRGAAKSATARAAELAPTTNDSLPGLDVARGASIWRSEDHYRKYLRLFVHEYAEVVARMRAGDAATAKSLAHKLKGAAANMALDGVAAAAGEVETDILGGGNGMDACARLQSAMDEALRSINRYAGVEPEPASATPVRESADPARLAAALKRALDAFNSDDPAIVEPALLELARILQGDRTAPLVAALDAFDFRGGEAATRHLARDLGLDLE